MYIMATRKKTSKPKSAKSKAAKPPTKRNRAAALKQSRSLARPDVFAVNVKRIREARGMTQSHLAEKLGWLQPRIAQIECGSQDRRMSTIQRVAAALGVDEVELLTEHAESPESETAGAEVA